MLEKIWDEEDPTAAMVARLKALAEEKAHGTPEKPASPEDQ